MNKILELRSKRNTLWEQTKSFLEEHRGVNDLVSAADIEQYDKMTADVMALTAEIKRLEDQMAMDAQMSAPTTSPVLMKPMSRKEKVKATATDEYSSAFWDMMRGNGHLMEVRNALSVGENEEGGYTVPDEFECRLVKGLEENNIFRQMAHVIRTSSGTRKIPIANDTMEASWIDEGEPIPETDTKFAQTTLSAYKMGALVKVSNELLNDSAFDIAAYIAERFGKTMGLTEEKAFITGSGDKQPTGILNDTVGAQLGVTAASANTVTFDEIFQLYYSLKSPYRAKAAFLCNEELLLQLMMLKDGNGNYIWKPSLDIAKPDTILGRPVYTSGFMPGVEAGKKVMTFGDYSYYWVADRASRAFKRLNELYAVTDQVGFVTTQRVDGKLILPEAVKVLKMAGTQANG
ncbi:MAG: phage major capsid protein [Clostridium sp.]|nr:phage major capsid protein [Clostridia bacterium]MBO6270224.1 phage major capsid protein [Clostridium sp.]